MKIAFSKRKGFTLFEIMIVVAIIGIIGAIGIPTMMISMKKQGMRKAISDFEEACAAAREKAIMTGHPAKMTINKTDKTISVSGEGTDSKGRSSFSATLPETIVIEGVGLYDLDYTEDEIVDVKFFPNGTADDLKIVLREAADQRGFAVDPTTGKALIENNPSRWMR